MTRPDDRPASPSKPWTRLLSAAWIVLAAALLALAALPLSAPADQPAAVQADAELAEAEADEEWEFEEECEEVEDEFEELEAFCEEVADESGGGSSAGKCPLRSAQAHATTRRNKLKVTVGYTTYTPVEATIEIRQGATRIGTFKRQLGKSGVLRFTKNVDEERAKKTAVRIHPSSGAAGCPSRRLVLVPH